MTTITSPRSFAHQRIDIVGPLPHGKKQVKLLLIVNNYFTKWEEGKALATIIEAKIQSFVRKNIICRFGIPRMVISDNGHRFDSQGSKSFCSNLCIKNQFSSLGLPQANGQIEVTNWTLLKIIKVQLEGAKGAWPNELPNVLWAYRTTARTPIGETPFNLTHDTKVVILVEVIVTSLTREFLDQKDNDGQLKMNWDCLDETRIEASRRIAKYQEKMAGCYNQRVKLRRFKIGYLVLRKVTPTTKDLA